MRVHYNKSLTQLARKLRNEPTQAEKRLWKELKNDQFIGYDFHRQKPIDKYIADFYCHKLLLVIELDGLSHHFEEVVQKDMKKETKLKELGFAVLRFNDGEVMQDIGNVIRAIEGYILDFEENEKLKKGI